MRFEETFENTHWGKVAAMLPFSAQRVPEPDPLPGISFDTRPDLIQF